MKRDPFSLRKLEFDSIIESTKRNRQRQLNKKQKEVTLPPSRFALQETDVTFLPSVAKQFR